MTETVTIEKQVWESTLNRSMVLEAENEQLKDLLKECREYMQDIQVQIEEDEYTMARNTAKLVKTKINQALGQE